MLTNKQLFKQIYENDVIWFNIYVYIFCRYKNKEENLLQYKNLKDLAENEKYYFSNKILKEFCNYKYINLLQFRLFNMKHLLNFNSNDFHSIYEYDFPEISFYNDLYDNTIKKEINRNKQYNSIGIYLFGKGSGLPIELNFTFSTSLHDLMNCEGDDPSKQPHPCKRILLGGKYFYYH
ncbi:hypothetical protein ABK040_001903 [Willaertia magna]